MSNRILVPYDGSSPAKEAVEYAFETFPDASVTALYVVPIPEGYWTAFDESDDEVEDRGRDVLDTARELAAEHDRDIESKVAVGQPDKKIVTLAEEDPYDTIVMGSHGREGVSRILLGSVAETVVRRAPIPVVVVR